mgnify:CR=1 FL=1
MHLDGRTAAGEDRTARNRILESVLVVELDTNPGFPPTAHILRYPWSKTARASHADPTTRSRRSVYLRRRAPSPQTTCADASSTPGERCDFVRPHVYLNANPAPCFNESLPGVTGFCIGQNGQYWIDFSTFLGCAHQQAPHRPARPHVKGPRPRRCSRRGLGTLPYDQVPAPNAPCSRSGTSRRWRPARLGARRRTPAGPCAPSRSRRACARGRGLKGRPGGLRSRRGPAWRAT